MNLDVLKITANLFHLLMKFQFHIILSLLCTTWRAEFTEKKLINNCYRTPQRGGLRSKSAEDQLGRRAEVHGPVERQATQKAYCIPPTDRDEHLSSCVKEEISTLQAILHTNWLKSCTICRNRSWTDEGALPPPPSYWGIENFFILEELLK